MYHFMLQMGVHGLSVTIPHKEKVLAHIDSIDPVAEKIGAVNTLVFKEDNKIHGLNTDWIGANRALSEKLDLQGKKILLLGAGGSAKAIGFGLLEAGARVILASRTESKVKGLAEILKCDWLHLSEIETAQADGLVNATSVGMRPVENASLVPETRLLREARNAGCETINGISMLLYQGVAQFEAWTDMEAPVEVMREALLKAMTE
jgi:shikimate dehydrogenase